MALTQVMITGTYKAQNAAAAPTGYVTFQLAAPITGTAGLAPRTPIEVRLVAGAIPANTKLYATDDTGSQPANNSYLVTEHIDGTPPRSYSIVVSVTQPGLTLDLSTVSPPLNSPAYSYLLTSAVSTDGTLAANSDALVPSQKAVKTYVDAHAGGGSVTSVSGTAPIVSSGGTTPAISIAAATAGAAGSMSAADKTKLDAITGTNTGDQTITLTGAVTGSGTGSFATTLAAAQVGSTNMAGWTVNAQVGTTYTLALADAFKIVTLNNGSAITLTLPKDATAAIPVGSEIIVTGIGAGLVTVAAESGATINNPTGASLTLAQYQVSRCIKTAANTWQVNKGSRPPDGSTLVVNASGQLGVPTGGITTTQIADGTITATDIASGVIAGRSIYGDGHDGNLTVSGTTTFTTDKYYDTLIVQNGGTLKLFGARIFCKTLCQVDAGGVIFANGNDGAAGGTAGSATSQGVLGGGAAGGAGGTAGGSTVRRPRTCSAAAAVWAVTGRVALVAPSALTPAWSPTPARRSRGSRP